MNTLSAETASRICAEQVIPDMPSIIKELLDNALDAHSTFVRITLMNYSIGGIEVCDDGVGIHSDDFKRLCKKGNTSKIEKIEDIGNIQTMGFRGEALASIAKLCNLEIFTRHKDEEVGFKIVYGDDGIIKNITQDHRGIGTTVKVIKIF